MLSLTGIFNDFLITAGLDMKGRLLTPSVTVATDFLERSRIFWLGVSSAMLDDEVFLLGGFDLFLATHRFEDAVSGSFALFLTTLLDDEVLDGSFFFLIKVLDFANQGWGAKLVSAGQTIIASSGDFRGRIKQQEPT
jgi:hypothetical protein